MALLALGNQSIFPMPQSGRPGFDPFLKAKISMPTNIQLSDVESLNKNWRKSSLVLDDNTDS